MSCLRLTIWVPTGPRIWCQYCCSSSNLHSPCWGLFSESLPRLCNNGDATTTVIDCLTEACVKHSAGANRQEIKGALEQNISVLFAFLFKKEPGLKQIKIRVSHPDLAKRVWDAKFQLPKQVFMDAELSPLERSNVKELATNPDFKAIRAAAKARNIKGHWLLDEFVIRWEAGDKQVRAVFHKAYPTGLLADGKPAPPFPGVAAAAAAGVSA